MNSNHNDLMCPIFLDWLEDPITLPCCGRAVSRQSIVLSLNNSSRCPLCASDLSNFDASNAVRSVNIAYLVEQAKNKSNTIKPDIEIIKPKWTIQISQLPLDNSAYQTKIGFMEIINTNNAFNFKTLLIPVIDKSGSMGGNPMNQVIYSLNRIVDLTYKYPNIITTLIQYDDRATSTPINKLQSMDHYRGIIQRIQAGGGTSFRSAFDEIKKVCQTVPSDVSSINIIFLTDGEDSSIIRAKRIELVNSLKESLKDVRFTLHTIGFGSNHDYDFLNNLRQIGSVEGAYRFADPSEDSDSLSNKINSLLDVIVTTVSIPLKIKQLPDDILIIDKEIDSKYWVDLTKINDFTQQFNLSIDVNEEVSDIVIEFMELTPSNEDLLKEKWYSYLIDNIAAELLTLSGNKLELDSEIHLELLQQRSNAIKSKLKSDTANYERLNKLMETIKALIKGESVNQSKLNDMKFEGRYATVKSLSNSQTLAVPVIPTAPVPIKKPSNSWLIFEFERKPRVTIKNNEMLKIITQSKHSDVVKWLLDNRSFTLESLFYATIIGRSRLVKEIMLELISDSIEIKDVMSIKLHNLNVVDVIILCGYYRTFDLFIPFKPSLDGQLLLRTCLSKKHYETAKRLIDHKIAIITEDMLDNVPTADGLEWLSLHSQKDITIENAILKGMVETVQSKLNNLTKMSLKPFISIFEKCTSDHIKIVELLIKNNLIDIDEEFKLDNLCNSGEEDEIYWPLFIACEKGNNQMVDLLIRYTKTVNKQNLKGTTPLWISSCNRHIDIVMNLLSNGADSNIANFKGDSPLIPCCQKGSESIAELLLEAGAKLDVYNKNRDNPLIICCRTGQHRILEMILKRVPISMFKEKADIDGFNPLLAATELDKTECIKVLLKYGDDIEFRTDSDNKIIKGATPLHLACFYGRLNAVKLLCESGANVLAKTIVGSSTPLHIAIKQGHIDVVRYLLTNKSADLLLKTPDDDLRLPSFYANMLGNEAIKEEFFAPNKLTKLIYKVSLTETAIKTKSLQKLINYSQSLGVYEYKDIINLDVGQGMTPLHMAILNGDPEMMNVLFKLGANPLKGDDYGISPAFWMEFFNPGTINDDNIKLQINRVNDVMNSNMQNKMLLRFNPGPLQLITDLFPVSIKMSDGFNSKMNKQALSALNNDQNNVSLLGFIDKFKNNPMILDGKIHLIKMIANQNDQILEPVHILSLYLYTGNPEFFKQVNLALSDWKEKNVSNQFTLCLYRAISLLKPFNGECYRAIDLKFNPEMFKIGDLMTWNMFGICSKSYVSCLELINNKRGVVFIIKSKTGRDISKYSRYPVDEEIIFLPQSQFKITNLYVTSITALGQENIRGSTYKTLEKDILKAVNGESSIMVELTE